MYGQPLGISVTFSDQTLPHPLRFLWLAYEYHLPRQYPVEIDGTEDSNHAIALRMVFQLRMVMSTPLGRSFSMANWLPPT